MAKPSSSPIGYAVELVGRRIRDLDDQIKSELKVPNPLMASVKAWQDERKLAKAHLAKLEGMA